MLLIIPPTLDGAKFEILDFSSPGKGQPRELSITDAKDIPRVSEEVKIGMLSVFAEGFTMAQEQLSRAPEDSSAVDEDRLDDNGEQPDLFDGDQPPPRK